MAEILEILLIFIRFGALSIGGGSSVLGEMQDEAIAQGWMTTAEFVRVYALGQITPGPQFLFVGGVGYYGGGILGGIAASLGYFAPTAFAVIGVALFLERFGESPWIDALRRSLGPVAIGLSAGGLYAIAPASLRPPWQWLVFAAAFLFILFFPRRSPLWVVGVGALAGGLIRVFA